MNVDSSRHSAPRSIYMSLRCVPKLKEWPSGSPDITGIGDQIQGHRPRVIDPRNVQ
jgi:hypothetical protein